jgi:hypothetical protein
MWEPDMRLFIRVSDGNPVGNPIFEGNFVEAFPGVDIDNLPQEFAEFIRVPPPVLDRFEVYEGVTYEKVGDKFTDIHHVRPMTEAEKQAFIEQLKGQSPGPQWRWNEKQLKWVFSPTAIPQTGGPWKMDRTSGEWVSAPEPPFPSWVLNEKGNLWVAPVPYPQDGKPHVWDEATLSWVPFTR